MKSWVLEESGAPPTKIILEEERQLVLIIYYLLRYPYFDALLSLPDSAAEKSSDLAEY
jgi:hypothetical protein